MEALVVLLALYCSTEFGQKCTKIVKDSLELQEDKSTRCTKVYLQTLASLSRNQSRHLVVTLLKSATSQPGMWDQAVPCLPTSAVTGKGGNGLWPTITDAPSNAIALGARPRR